MALSAIVVTRAKPRDKAYKLADSGGLVLLVTPSGGRYWRLNYRFGGKYRTMALGVFPDVGLAAARSKRDEARQALAAGNDPAVRQKLVAQQLQLDAASSFKAVAIEWLAKREKEGLAEITLDKAKWLLDFPHSPNNARQKQSDSWFTGDIIAPFTLRNPAGVRHSRHQRVIGSEDEAAGAVFAIFGDLVLLQDAEGFARIIGAHDILGVIRSLRPACARALRDIV